MPSNWRGFRDERGNALFLNLRIYNSDSLETHNVEGAVAVTTTDIQTGKVHLLASGHGNSEGSNTISILRDLLRIPHEILWIGIDANAHPVQSKKTNLLGTDILSHYTVTFDADDQRARWVPGYLNAA